MKSILDKSFVYVPASKSDIRKTFERLKREARRNEAEAKSKVSDLRKHERKA